MMLIQGVPQNCIHFVLGYFSASYEPYMFWKCPLHAELNTALNVFLPAIKINILTKEGYKDPDNL